MLCPQDPQNRLKNCKALKVSKNENILEGGRAIGVCYQWRKFRVEKSC